MATSKIQVLEGSGKNLATNSFTEDAVTKELSRVVLNSSSGTEITTLPVSVSAGSNLIGKVSTDQTTHGTSDLVAADITKVAGSAISQGHGTAATAIRVELPTDGTGVVGLIAGTATVGAVNVKPTTTGGLSTYHLVSAGTTNATNIKASAGQVFGWYIYNSNAAARKVAFHNTAGTPTAGSSIFFALVIPAGGAANVELTNGIAFSTGIGITTVTDLTDAGSTAVSANDLIINIFYS